MIAMLLVFLTAPLFFGVIVGFLTRNNSLYLSRDGLQIAITVRQYALGWIPIGKKHYQPVLSVRLEPFEATSDDTTYAAARLFIQTPGAEHALERIAGDHLEDVQKIARQIDQFIRRLDAQRLQIHGNRWQSMVASHVFLAITFAIFLVPLESQMSEALPVVANMLRAPVANPASGKTPGLNTASGPAKNNGEITQKNTAETTPKNTPIPSATARPAIELPDNLPPQIFTPPNTKPQSARFDSNKKQWRVTFYAETAPEHIDQLAEQTRAFARSQGWQVSQIRRQVGNLYDFGYRTAPGETEGDVQILSLEDHLEIWLIWPAQPAAQTTPPSPPEKE